LIQFYSGKFNGDPIPLKDDAQVLEFFDKIWKGNDLNKIVSETLKREDFWGEDLSKLEGLTEIIVKDLEFHLFF
jgi:tagaturonate reductase